jgi:hypothetical protein
VSGLGSSGGRNERTSENSNPLGTPVNKGKKKADIPKGEPRLYLARCLSGRTIKTGQCACLTTEEETLPIRALRTPPKPRLPMTMSPTPSSSAKWTMA